MTREDMKKTAAYKAAEFVKSGMVVGLGTGTTAKHAILRISELLKTGTLENIRGIPTSIVSEKLARENGIPLTNFDENPVIDLTIDGADEVDSELNLIKGGGGALLREKVVAQASKTVIIAVDESKISRYLGEKFFVPIEVLKFAKNSEKLFLESLNAEVNFRKNDGGTLYETDEGNLILDCKLGVIRDPEDLALILSQRAGIVEHGIFVGLASKVIAAGQSGIKILEK